MGIGSVRDLGERGPLRLPQVRKGRSRRTHNGKSETGTLSGNPLMNPDEDSRAPWKLPIAQSISREHIDLVREFRNVIARPSEILHDC